MVYLNFRNCKYILDSMLQIQIQRFYYHVRNSHGSNHIGLWLYIINSISQHVYCILGLHRNKYGPSRKKRKEMSNTLTHT